MALTITNHRFTSESEAQSFAENLLDAIGSHDWENASDPDTDEEVN